MKVNFNAVLKDLSDTDIKLGPEDGAKPLTLGFISMIALQDGDNNDNLLKKLESFRLLRLIHDAQLNGGTVDISPEQSTHIKDKIGVLRQPITIVGRAVELLNG